MIKDGVVPAGWCWARLDELVNEAQNGFGKRRQAQGTPAIVLRLADVQDGQICLESPRRVNSTVEETKKYQLVANDLIAIRVNGSPDLVGRLIRFLGHTEPVLYCDHFIRLRPFNAELSAILRFYADTPDFRRHVERTKVSTAGQNTVSQGSVGSMRVALPPTNEQRRIVQKIEELFSKLDAGVAALERVKANLKRYRAAVLKAAVEGKLTAEWRAKHPDTEPASKLLERILKERRRKWEEAQLAKYADAGKEPPKEWENKYPEPAKSEPGNPSEMPASWTWAAVEQLYRADRPISYGVLQPGDNLPDGVPLVRVCDIRDGRVSIEQMKKIAPRISAQYQRTLLRGGEVLLTVVGTIGRTAVVPSALRGANTARAVAVIAIVPPTDPHFIEIVLRESSMRARLTRAAHEVARKTLNLEDVRTACLPFAPLPEQHEIVAEVERRLSIVDELAAQVEADLKRAGRLRQSILKRAFAGRLVPQDPSDEPAEKLLERILASRADGTETTEGRKSAERRRMRAGLQRKGNA